MEEIFNNFNKELEKIFQTKTNNFIKDILSDTKNAFDKLWDSMMKDVIIKKNKTLAEIQLLEKSINTLKTQAKEAQNEYNIKKTEKDSLEKEVADLQKLRDDLSTQIAKEKLIYNTMKNKEKELEDKEKQVESEKVAVETQKALLKEREDSLKRVFNQMSKK